MKRNQHKKVVKNISSERRKSTVSKVGMGLTCLKKKKARVAEYILGEDNV